MHKQRVLRTPLIAVLALLAFLAIPAGAQAHHIEGDAACTLVGGERTVTFNVHFVGFSDNAKPSIRGSVWLEGVDGTLREWQDAAPPLTWNGDNATLTTSWTVSSEGPFEARAYFKWKHFTKWYEGKLKELTEKCPSPPAKNPAISLDKTGAATATAGSTFTYSFVATNTGDVPLEDVALTDNRCQSTLTRVEPNLADTSFDPGDKWYYRCTVVAPAGPATVNNTAEVCGTYTPGQGKPPVEVCDTDTHTFTVPPPTTPPATPPVTPPTTPTTPTTPTQPEGEGGVLPETVVSGRARLRGPSGCVKQAFRARVTGRAIRSVTFFVDGRKVKKDRGGNAFLKVNPKRYGLGRHKIVALVRFRAASGTPARRLSLTFRRCAQGAVAPRFTG